MLDIEFTLDEIIERTFERPLWKIEFHIGKIPKINLISKVTKGHLRSKNASLLNHGSG